MISNIHPTAIIGPEVQLDENVKIGPYTVLDGHIHIGEGTKIGSHVVVEGHVKLGKNNSISHFSHIGGKPQDLSYKDEPTRIEIGDNNIFREYVSIHRGTTKQGQVTKIGNNCYIMDYVHLGHDVNLGNSVRIVNSVNLAGHVQVGDNCIISGGCNIAQFIRIGKGSFLGGATIVDKDVLPFSTALGNRVKIKGVNIIGMRRSGHKRDAISLLIDFFKSLEASNYSARAFVDREELMKEYKGDSVIEYVSNFIGNSEVGIAPFN